jgi:hypothetical protein
MRVWTFLLASFLVGFALRPQALVAEETFTSPFSDRTASLEKWLRFKNTSPEQMIKALQDEGFLFIYLNPQFDPKVTDPRNGDLKPEELQLFLEYAKLASEGADWLDDGDEEKKEQAPEGEERKTKLRYDALYTVPWFHLPPSAKGGPWRMLPRPDKKRIVLIVDPGAWPGRLTLVHEYGHSLFNIDSDPVQSATKEKFCHFDVLAMWRAHFNDKWLTSKNELAKAKGTDAEPQAQLHRGEAIIGLSTWALRQSLYQLEVEGDVYSLQIATYKDFNLTAEEASEFPVAPWKLGTKIATERKAVVADQELQAMKNLPQAIKQRIAGPHAEMMAVLRRADKAVAKVEAYVNKAPARELMDLILQKQEQRRAKAASKTPR